MFKLIEDTPFDYLKEDKNYVAFLNKTKLFLAKVVKGDFENREDAKKKKYLKELGSKMKKIKEPKEKINTESRPIKARDFVKELEYIIFGTDKEQASKSEKQTTPEESGKIDIATGGYDADKAIPIPLPEVETEEDAARRQKGQGLKIMTPSQLITKLSILLAQLKAGNNSQKLKNEIRQIVYSLYRSKNLTKTIYNHLINSI